MNKPGKYHIFTLYFQKTPDDERWIDSWTSIEALAYQAQNLQWRLDHEWKACKTLLDFFRSGIYIDTIEQPRVAVFISGEVEIEVAGKNGKTRIQTMKTWGCGGKTTAQLWRKLIALFTEVLNVLDWASTWDRRSNVWMSWGCWGLSPTMPRSPSKPMAEGGAPREMLNDE